MKRLGRWIHTLFAIVGLLAVVGVLVLLSGGISARSEPTRMEAAVALRLRSWGIPASQKERGNPVPRTPEAIEAAMVHWTDHCANCHGTNGDGQTEMGRGLYPRVPDMRLPATQNLSDGSLFYIIEHGVKLTGMPAWGTGTREGETESWKLVHLIRQLPNLTPEQIERMEAMQPVSPTALSEEEQIERFLRGEGDGPKSATAPAPHGGHK